VTEFVDLLKAQGIRLLVDVRTVPRSRSNPQFNDDVLPQTLAQTRSAMSVSPRWEACAQSSAKSREA
jgi:uncharacterized protein (DUF488 family)